MIRFALACTHDHEFEGWFRSNGAFDEQVASGALACPFCGDRTVRKAIMAPAVARGGQAAGTALAAEPADGTEIQADPRRERLVAMMAMMHALRRHVTENFEDVGVRFPEEARKMHFGEIDRRGIYGQATGEQVKDLIEDGVPVHPLPLPPKLDG